MKQCTTFDTKDQVDKEKHHTARTLPENVFPYLAIGLAKYTESEQKYPYPPELLYALNQLSLVMLTTYPSTITDLFALFAKCSERFALYDLII